MSIAKTILGRMAGPALAVVMGAALSASAVAATIWQAPLPGNATYVNGNSGGNRANYGYTGGSFNPNGMLGDTFQSSITGTVNSLTFYELSNTTDTQFGGGSFASTPGQEFASINLYYGGLSASPTPNEQLSGVQSSNNYTATYTQLAGGQNYEGLDALGNGTGVYYDVYAITFNNLNLAVTAGNTYAWAVNSNPIGGNSLYLAAGNSTNTVASGIATFNGDDSFAVFNPTPDPSFYTGVDGSITGDPNTDLNVIISGQSGAGSTPEPSSLAMMAIGAGAVALGAFRKRNA